MTQIGKGPDWPMSGERLLREPSWSFVNNFEDRRGGCERGGSDKTHFFEIDYEDARGTRNMRSVNGRAGTTLPPPNQSMTEHAGRRRDPCRFT